MTEIERRVKTRPVAVGLRVAIPGAAGRASVRASGSRSRSRRADHRPN